MTCVGLNNDLFSQMTKLFFPYFNYYKLKNYYTALNAPQKDKKLFSLIYHFPNLF